MTQECKFVYDNDAYFPATQNEYMIIHWTTGHIFLAPFSKIKQLACVYSLFSFQHARLTQRYKTTTIYPTILESKAKPKIPQVPSIFDSSGRCAQFTTAYS